MFFKTIPQTIVRQRQRAKKLFKAGVSRICGLSDNYLERFLVISSEHLGDPYSTVARLQVKAYDEEKFEDVFS